MLPVQLAEAFLLAEAVELSGDDDSGGLVGGACELGVELQGRRGPESRAEEMIEWIRRIVAGFIGRHACGRQRPSQT